MTHQHQHPTSAAETIHIWNHGIHVIAVAYTDADGVDAQTELVISQTLDINLKAIEDDLRRPAAIENIPGPEENRTHDRTVVLRSTALSNQPKQLQPALAGQSLESDVKYLAPPTVGSCTAAM